MTGQNYILPFLCFWLGPAYEEGWLKLYTVFGCRQVGTPKPRICSRVNCAWIPVWKHWQWSWHWQHSVDADTKGLRCPLQGPKIQEQNKWGSILSGGSERTLCQEKQKRQEGVTTLVARYTYHRLCYSLKGDGSLIRAFLNTGQLKSSFILSCFKEQRSRWDQEQSLSIFPFRQCKQSFNNSSILNLKTPNNQPITQWTN